MNTTEYHENTIVAAAPRDAARTLRALQAIEDDVSRLLEQPAGSLTWLSTVSDLLELVHTAWLTGHFYDSLRRPMTFTDMARRAFAVVGRPLPKNHRYLLMKTRQRRDPRRSMLARYALNPPLTLARLVKPSGKNTIQPSNHDFKTLQHD
jgi:hypothetical protein